VFYVDHTRVLEFINAANFLPIAVPLGWLGEVFPVRWSVRQQTAESGLTPYLVPNLANIEPNHGRAGVGGNRILKIFNPLNA
jgi:hypothetical protein